MDKFISPLITAQFPNFYRTEGPNFIAFIKAYYEWMEQEGNVLNSSRSLLDYMDIDKTEQQFIKHFKDTYIHSLSEAIISDKQLLVKHILDLYRTKGTQRAYELLFRLLFNESIELYIPNNFLFKPSDATWSVPRYIEVTGNPYLQNLIGTQITNSSQSASAIVENIYQKIENNKVVNVIYLSSVTGRFKYGEQILSTSVPEITLSNAPIVTGSLTAVAIESGGYDYSTGDILDVMGSGSGGKARVISTVDENGKVVFDLVNGGQGYSMNAVVTVAVTKDIFFNNVYNKFNYGEGAFINIDDNGNYYYVNGGNSSSNASASALFTDNNLSFNIGDNLLDINTGANGTVTSVDNGVIQIINFSENLNFNVGDTITNGNNIISYIDLSTNYTAFQGSTFTHDNAIAPDGTLTAGTLTVANEPNSGLFTTTFPTNIGTLYTYEISAKYVSGGNIYQFGSDSNDATILFNIQTGEISLFSVFFDGNPNDNYQGGSAYVAYAEAIALGNGWFRLVVSYVSQSNTSGVILYNNSDAGNIVGTLLLADLQVSSSPNPPVLAKVVGSSGGGGAGATFNVGGLTNQQVYYLNTDYISNVSSNSMGINLDIGSSSNTYVVTFNANTGVFSGAGNTIYSSTNSVTLDCSTITTSNVVVGESLSNTSLGISGLYVYRSEPNLVWVAGPDSALTNANLVSGKILISNTTASKIQLINVFAKENIVGNGIITSISGSGPYSVGVSFPSGTVNGYFISTGTLKDSNTGHTANIVSVTRTDNWGYFTTSNYQNLDLIIGQTLNYVSLSTGTITYLSGINPGTGYSSNPYVSVIEPQIAALNLSDGVGGIIGFDAVVSGQALSANGIVSSVEIIDSGFGYVPGETVSLRSENLLNQTSPYGTTVIDLDGHGTGYWSDNKSFVSDGNYLQDNYFYQQFSYQIVAERMISTYESLVRDLIHPSGIALFGKFSLNREMISDQSEPEQFIISQNGSVLYNDINT